MIMGGVFCVFYFLLECCKGVCALAFLLERIKAIMFHVNSFSFHYCFQRDSANPWVKYEWLHSLDIRQSEYNERPFLLMKIWDTVLNLPIRYIFTLRPS